MVVPRQGHPADLAAVALSLEVNIQWNFENYLILTLTTFGRFISMIFLFKFSRFIFDYVEVSGSPAREAAFQLLSKYRQVLLNIIATIITTVITISRVKPSERGSHHHHYQWDQMRTA